MKNRLFIAIVFLLFVPLLLDLTELIKIKPLSGSYKKHENPSLSLNSWFSGDYQLEKENYINQNIYLRPLWVRFYNQYYYTFYKEAKANSVIIGKSAYLYEENYIKAHLGRDFIGRELITEKVNKLQKLSDTLKQKGIELIVILAPGKGSFYPEYIPKRYDPQHRTVNNFEVYNESLLSTRLHYLDFNSWFIDNKSTSEYPLYPKTGIHWSKYGELLAADSIIQYINSILPNKKAPRLSFGTMNTSTNMHDTDDDIEKGMNLLFNIPDLEMAYPKYSWEEGLSKEQPKVLTIADSYYWGMFNLGLSRDAFNGGQFWFYNKNIYPDSYEKHISVEDINIVDEVEKNDVIILMSTDANLYKFAFGFVDQLYAAYFETKSRSGKNVAIDSN